MIRKVIVKNVLYATTPAALQKITTACKKLSASYVSTYQGQQVDPACRKLMPPETTATRLLGVALPAKAVPRRALRCPRPFRLVGAAPPAGRAQWCATAKSVKHGPYWRWHRGGGTRGRPFRLAEAGIYRQGQQHGPWRTWYATGILESEGRYLTGKQSGRWEYYHPNGTLRTSGLYFRGREEGAWKQWSPHGQLLQEQRYLNGRLHGPHREWHPSGQRKAVGFYDRGRRRLLWRWFHPSGRVQRRRHYR
jgi:hypothetical protein